MPISVAVDGPVGAGKSTIARAAAARLGFVYCDTGALYRAVGLYCVRQEIIDDKDKIEECLDDISVSLRIVNGYQKVYLNGDDVSAEIRFPAISMAASTVSAIPAVRNALLGIQRKIAEENDVIMDGRDIGTVVLPDADVKIVLTAKAEIRAERRYTELRKKGVKTTYEQVLDDLKRRDYNDTHRAAAPLRLAEGAKLADTSELDFEQSVDLICGIIEDTVNAE